MMASTQPLEFAVPEAMEVIPVRDYMIAVSTWFIDTLSQALGTQWVPEQSLCTSSPHRMPPAGGVVEPADVGIGTITV
jgi:hypothetical protein